MRHVWAIPLHSANRLPWTSREFISFETRMSVTTLKSLAGRWRDERGQDIAEYAVMLGVILTIVVGTIRLIGSHADNVFSSVGSAIQ